MKLLCFWPVATSFLLLAGCQKSPDSPSAGTGEQSPTGTAAKQADEAEIQANIAKLSPEDRKLAEEQRFCAVLNDSRLGSMGKPLKVMVKDQPVFLCCKGCSKKAQSNPDQTLAKAKELREKNAPSTRK